MSVGKPEIVTQKRVIRLFTEKLGYKYLGNLQDQEDNSNVDKEILSYYLKQNDYTEQQIKRVIYKLDQERNNTTRSLYVNNKEVYSLLRYGVDVKTEPGEPSETIRLIDWHNPANNQFAIAEEVTLKGEHDRRPDLVLYINGIAIAVIELKNSRISIGEGIRQLISNQRDEFHSNFFSTIQLTFAGNDSEGLKYGTIETKEKYYLKWKEDEKDNNENKLDKYLIKMCNKTRILELMYDFIIFDRGTKKVPRFHQYFAVKAAQEHVKGKKGGIIWHTQGSGKSIIMVMLAKWILENNHNARVAIITDRDELDKQIEGVFQHVGESIIRTTSGRNLMNMLSQAHPRLLCSLIHKFGANNDKEFNAYIKEIEESPTKTVGDIFVFVDECHRTQSGKLNRAMKAIMPDAIFIGFTGTPLLKTDKKTTYEVFGQYIDTYKFSEAVEDEVILDLVYEARDINQEITSEDRIDQWFESKTRGLNDWQKDELKKKWATMKKVNSSYPRMKRLVNDIVFDFNTKPRLMNGRGNAMLVASSIYEACRYFKLFQETELRNECAVITSYNPNIRDVSTEDTGFNTDTEKKFTYSVYDEILRNIDSKAGRTKAETYEADAKYKFIHEPSNMKLLIVVDKLLTGFDAPPCTYLYIDKPMQDHGLFQAICRTNRLDGDDKIFGYIIDYKDLFKKLEHAIAVYTSELDHSAEGAPPEIVLQDRLKRGKEKLEDAIEVVIDLCEPVEQPKGEVEYIRYFCGNSEIESDLKERESRRAALYKAVASFARSYANIADDIIDVGYSLEKIEDIKKQLKYYVNIRDLIRNASGETLDTKPYEADMRYLIDTYIDAEESKKISAFDDIGLLDLIVKSGVAEAINSKLPSLKDNKEAIAEVIESNVRDKISKNHSYNPAYYDKMSQILEEIIRNRKEKADEYAETLRKLADLAKQVTQGYSDKTPEILDTPGKRILYDNLKEDEKLTLAIDKAVKENAHDGWRNPPKAKQRAVKKALYEVLKDEDEVERIFLIVKEQKEY